MEPRKKLEDLHSESLSKLNEYMDSKKDSIKTDDHAKLHDAKTEWQAAWAKLMEALIVLERIEI